MAYSRLHPHPSSRWLPWQLIKPRPPSPGALVWEDVRLSPRGHCYPGSYDRGNLAISKHVDGESQLLFWASEILQEGLKDGCGLHWSLVLRGKE